MQFQVNKKQSSNCWFHSIIFFLSDSLFSLLVYLILKVLSTWVFEFGTLLYLHQQIFHISQFLWKLSTTSLIFLICTILIFRLFKLSAWFCLHLQWCNLKLKCIWKKIFYFLSQKLQFRQYGEIIEMKIFEHKMTLIFFNFLLKIELTGKLSGEFHSLYQLKSAISTTFWNWTFWNYHILCLLQLTITAWKIFYAEIKTHDFEGKIGRSKFSQEITRL